MTDTALTEHITQHGFFKELDAKYIPLIADCAHAVEFQSGDFLSRTDTPANTFYALLSGQIAVELPVAGQGAIVIQTLLPGTLFGWSWIFPPYLWQFDCRATQTSQTLAFNGACLRAKCDNDPALGYAFMKKFAHLMTKRLQATRLQLLDVYAHPNSGI